MDYSRETCQKLKSLCQQRQISKISRSKKSDLIKRLHQYDLSQSMDVHSLKIEDSIDKSVRLEDGIFFTNQESVHLITSNYDFKQIKTIIDTAAGACNLLLSLAAKYPHIQFYGIEKNVDVFTKTLELIRPFDNITYLNGDMLFDDFDIPPCDLYLGNPPWINYVDIAPEYQNKVRSLWKEYFTIETGFNMLLGDSRGDISQLCMYHSIAKFLKEDGRFSVIMPLSAIRSQNKSSADFREFKHLTIGNIKDISKLDSFANTERSACVLEGRKGGVTSFPIRYDLYQNKTQYETTELHKKDSCLVFSEGIDILGKSPYKARQGVNTLGANGVFFFKKQPCFSSELIKRLLKSSDIRKWTYSPSYWILMPYLQKKILTETELSQYPDEYDYLVSHKETLQNRKTKLIKGNFYQLFGIGDYTFKLYKVVWRGLGAKTLECVVVGPETVPNQSMNCYISTDDKSEAYYICGIMNSQLYEKQVMNMCESGSKSFGQPNIINNIFIPLYEDTNQLHKNISHISEAFHDKQPDEHSLRQLEAFVSSLYNTFS